MKRKTGFVLILVLIIDVLFINSSVFAGLEEAKARIRDRVSQVAELKLQGIIGENNRGFLEFVGENKTKKEIVEAENADRLIVYTDIAKQTGGSVEAVGKKRALDLANKAVSGSWLQNADGNWYQKQ